MCNQTWEIVHRKEWIRPILAKWIFKVKPGTSGQSPKLKVRIVARGFQQQEGVDFDDIFAPVVRWSTIRMVLALATRNCWKIRQMDVITAF
jgi:hypothetical protein